LPSNNSIITVIIPNYNGKRFLGTCLDSIIRQTFRRFSITVVDNGSVDGSVEFIRDHYTDVWVVEFKENKGFGAAVNEGIKETKSKYICLLNNDVELDPDFLKEMITVLEQKRDVDYCAAKMFNYYDRKLLDGAGDGVFRAGAGYRLGTLEYDVGIYDEPMYVFGACAGAAVYRRSFFEKVGYFDEDFFAYLEDVDINFRANLFGLRCSYIPTAKLFHVGSGTTGSSFNSFSVRLTTKNTLNVVVKNYPSFILLKCLPVFFLYHVFWALLVLKRKQLSAHFGGLKGALDDLPKMWRKRREVLSRKKITNVALWSKILDSEREVMKSISRRRRGDGKSTWPITIYMRIFL
jgi:GT2 family glycosyltransferase